jgi:hypothetical protein
MSGSYAYRILLAGLLPVIAVLLYFEGQRYDPALIRFDRIQSDSGTTIGLLPGSIEGFSLLGRVRSYTKDNLYEYVDGHAEYFISAGFAGLAVGEYGASNTAGPDPDVTIDIYDMGKSIQAFGVLSDESGGNLVAMKGGLTGFRFPAGISFASGRYYVKISTYTNNVPLEAIAVRVAGSLGEASGSFPELTGLPDIGAVAATRFIKEAYRGLDFLNNVIEREYNVGGSTVDVFIVTKETGDIDEITESFMKYFKQSGIPYTGINRGNSTVYAISDPYEGDWSMIVFPESLIGVFGAPDETIINKILEKEGKVSNQG